MTQRFGFAPVFGDVRKRAGHCQWVAEIIGTKISLMKEVRKMGGSGTVHVQIANYSSSGSSAEDISELDTNETNQRARMMQEGLMVTYFKSFVGRRRKENWRAMIWRKVTHTHEALRV